MSTTTDVLIIGGGPAGLTAALTLARQIQTCVVFDSGTYRNDRSKNMHVVPTWDHADPNEFRTKAREELLTHYDTVQIENVSVDGLKKTDTGLFEATTADGKTWTGKKVILATGVEDIMPPIEGYADCWGDRIYHCFFCKGYEDRGAASSGILAFGGLAHPAKALHAARHALPLSKAVTIYTDGSTELASQLDGMLGTATQMKTDTRKIKKLVKAPSNDSVTIHFEDGTDATEAFLGHMPDFKVRGSFLTELGVEMSPSGDIKTAMPFPKTNIPGVHAVGDAASPFKLTQNATYQGALAGSLVSAEVIADQYQQKSMF